MKFSFLVECGSQGLRRHPWEASRHAETPLVRTHSLLSWSIVTMQNISAKCKLLINIMLNKFNCKVCYKNIKTFKVQCHAHAETPLGCKATLTIVMKHCYNAKYKCKTATFDSKILRHLSTMSCSNPPCKDALTIVITHCYNAKY